MRKIINTLDNHIYTYRGINLSKNAKFEKLSDLIKDSSLFQVTLKNGDDGEKETERMIMLFSDNVVTNTNRGRIVINGQDTDYILNDG